MQFSNEQYNQGYDSLQQMLQDGRITEGSPEHEFYATELQQYHAGLMQQERDAFGQRIDLSPQSGVPQVADAVGGPGGPRFAPIERGTEEAPERARLLDQAAEGGIDIHTGLDAGTRAKVSLVGESPEARLMALNYFITEDFKNAGVKLPQGIRPVFRDANTGELAYLRPVAGGKFRPTLVNGYGADVGDAAGASGDLIPAALETAGAAAGGFAAAAVSGGAGTAAGAVAGAGLGGAVSKDTVRLVGRLAGIPEDVLPTIENEERLKDALIAMGSEALVPLTLGTVRMMRNVGRPLDPEIDDLDSLQRTFEEARAEVRGIRDRTGVDLKATVGEATGHPLTLIEEATSRARLKGAADAGDKAFEMQRRLDLAEATRRLADPNYDMALPPEPNTTSALAREELRRPITDSEDELISAQRSIDDVYESLSESQELQPFELARLQFSDAAKRAEEVEEASWDRFRDLAGYNPDTGVSRVRLRNRGDTPLNRAVQGLNQNATQALSRSLQKAQSNFAEDFALDAPRGLNLHEVHKLRSHLANEQRRIRNSASQLNWTAEDVQSVLDAIDTQMQDPANYVFGNNRAVGLDEARAVSSAFIEASNNTISKAAFFDHAAAGRILEINEANGRFRMAADKLRGEILKPGDSGTLRMILDAKGMSPHTEAGVLRELESMYRESVFKVNPDGTKAFLQARHDDFLRDFGGHLQVLTGGSELRSGAIRNARDFQRIVEQKQLAADRISRVLRRELGDQFASPNTTGGDIVEGILSSNLTPGRTRALMGQLEAASPQLADEVRRLGQAGIASRLSTQGGLDPQLTSLSRLLENSSDQLRVLYGQDYVDGLRMGEAVLKAQKVASRAAAETAPDQALALRGFRVLFGPLSPIQRRLTFGTQVRGAILQNKRRARLVNAALSDPNAVRNLVRVGQAGPGSITALTAFLQAGFTAEDLPEQERQMLELVQQRNPNFLEQFQ